MKYMTFNRSCSYAGLANLLEEFEIHYEDHEIIKALNIPYLFIYNEQEDSYSAGAMIQSLPWFNYFLNTLGFNLIEEFFNPQQAINILNKSEKRYMVGILNDENSNLKHAVIFECKEGAKYRFLNLKHKDSIEPDYIFFSEEELNEKLPEKFPMGYLIKNNEIINFDATDQIKYSLENIEKYKNRIIEFCSKKQEITEIVKVKDTLFAPLLLDILSMMELIGENTLANKIKYVQTSFLKAMNEKKTVLLTDYFSIEQIADIISQYKLIIADKLK